MDCLHLKLDCFKPEMKTSSMSNFKKIKIYCEKNYPLKIIRKNRSKKQELYEASKCEKLQDFVPHLRFMNALIFKTRKMDLNL